MTDINIYLHRENTSDIPETFLGLARTIYPHCKQVDTINEADVIFVESESDIDSVYKTSALIAVCGKNLHHPQPENVVFIDDFSGIKEIIQGSYRKLLDQIAPRLSVA